MPSRDRLRLGLIGAGWITPMHLAALRGSVAPTLVGVAWPGFRAPRPPRTHECAAYDDIERMLDEQRPEVVYVAVPPSVAVAACDAVVARGIPFLAEKPLAAADASGPARIAAAVEARGLVAAVGYHLRSLETLPGGPGAPGR